eukprot:CAMPEP_0114575254 /NCGR_PEP_ID=MMETSP0125-20121206/152_1 /TAXON_ID=485358 ORGANISM="Aristerostoma sp., Strain ATCC 50986" /NCGR_SAMPLE_ID=MMETSP0125 /ASSEMBLY_ACC=CAM_ASM_000245 /LENGTH=63 /DNA_ID=CAMNT_0001762857 /DNA_START=462 /DNA_END=653 /DNA_ORIENTATION=+
MVEMMVYEILIFVGSLFVWILAELDLEDSDEAEELRERVSDGVIGVFVTYSTCAIVFLAIHFV